MAGWVQALARTRAGISNALSRLTGRGSTPDATTLEEIEETLIRADLPMRLVVELIDELSETTSKTSPMEIMRDRLLSELEVAPDPFEVHTERPTVVLLVGTNGSGKTTTAAKLAHRALGRGLTPMLCAGDTFRAAGSEQLRRWSEMIGCASVGGEQGADAAAVAYDALDGALARKADMLFVDTAGRMHTRQPLMAELEKVQRALNKRMPDAPHETWIVLDAALGQNALAQARAFNEALPLSGVVISKLDGSARGGFIFGVARELKVPIRFVGLGEEADDLAPFEPDAFVDALLGQSEVVVA